MPPTTCRPYGLWDSPIEAAKIFAKSTSLSEFYVDAATSHFYHVESRPAEGGRSVLVETLTGRELVGSKSNVRDRCHEYGGGSADVRRGWAVWSEFESNLVFRRPTEGVHEAEQVVPTSQVFRYADFSIHPHHPHLIAAIREDHTRPAPADVVNTLVLIDAKHQHVHVLRSGRDFYAAPRWSEGTSGDGLCWIEWDHPDMPWEGSELHVGRVNLDSGKVIDSSLAAGAPGSESVSQPAWMPGSDDTLLFLCDRSGYLNLYRYSIASKRCEMAMHELSQDLAEPAWQFGEQQFAPLSSRDALIAPNDAGERILTHLDLASGKLTPIKAAQEYRDVKQLRRVNERQAVFLGSTARRANVPVIVTFPSGVQDGEVVTEVRQLETRAADCGVSDIPSDYISIGETITIHTDFPPPGAVDHTSDLTSTTNSPPRKVPLHCVLYSPVNPHFTAPPGELPPAIVLVHGGPTSRSPPVYQALKQYFTSRGFAILDVDYGGSSGYGRAYAQRLKGNWGIVDTYDSGKAVTELAKLGKIDGRRVAIQGGSAGGYTTLACLTDLNVFTAGISLFGVADLKLLADDTHKFESQYLFKLIGGTPAEVPAIYHDRSPLFKAERIKAALLVMQGLDDKVVPPEQARKMVEKIESAKGDVEAVYYEGEGHGFRKMENLIDMLERQLAFLQRAFKLEK